MPADASSKLDDRTDRRLQRGGWRRPRDLQGLRLADLDLDQPAHPGRRQEAQVQEGQPECQRPRPAPTASPAAPSSARA
ncbi:hypothetical protein G5V59_26875 [Nocardioides sp. W3-2-3]|uniref:hypothetical protein n=1 Tax=Nocardioides convexus TaxID=2712224 RepID=UPI0024183BCA|nr:hypothetical protein [Nocardioides convexus]NHA02017.1 hypothetical protein [Nocardioides convexus]